MQEWLNDRKNLPIIGAITGLVVVAAIAIVYLTMRGSSESSTPPEQSQYAAQPGPSYPSAPQGQAVPGTATPGPEAYPTPQPTTPVPQAYPTTQPTAVAPTEEPTTKTRIALLPYRQDPFLPFDYKPPSRRPKPRIVLPPIGPLVIPKERQVTPVTQEDVLPPQPSRRMSGVMHNGSVYAILESSGETIVVKPGDIVENGNVRVDAIEPDRILLSWLRTKKPIPIEVRLSEGSPDETASAAPAETGPVFPGPPGFGARGGVRTPRSYSRITD